MAAVLLCVRRLPLVKRLVLYEVMAEFNRSKVTADRWLLYTNMHTFTSQMPLHCLFGIELVAGAQRQLVRVYKPYLCRWLLWHLTFGHLTICCCFYKVFKVYDLCVTIFRKLTVQAKALSSFDGFVTVQLKVNIYN